MAAQRVTASGKNLRVSLAGHMMTVIFNFVTRRMFISLLGSEYAGFSGLCGHILNFLSLLEPGFDAACAFYLYRPLADGDIRLTGAVMAYIKRIYRRVSVITFFIGTAAFPIVVILSKKSVTVPFAASVYFLLLFEMCMSYLLVHRHILPVSDQKSYTVNGFGYIVFIVTGLIRLFVLFNTHNYIAYLFAGITVQLAGEIILYRRISGMYPYINGKAPELPENARLEIVSKVRSLFFHKTGAILCGSADNMAVFVFLGLGAGTMYSNYTMLSGICLAFISIVTNSAAASVGDLGVTGNRQRMYKVYTTAFFAIVMLGAFFAQSLFFTYPFIVEMWVGKDMVLGDTTTALFCAGMFISALRRPTGIFLDGFGLFDKEKYKAITEAVLTVTATLVFAPSHGISGVLLGQITGTVCFSLWYEPYILFRYGFKTDMRMFIRDILKYIFAVLLSFVFTSVIVTCGGNGFDGISAVIFRVTVSALSVLSVFFILFFDSDRLVQTVRYGRKMLKKG